MSSLFQRPDAPVEVKSAIALCIGTAVKNNYDYQLWTLESNATSSTGPLALALVQSLSAEWAWRERGMTNEALLPEESEVRSRLVNNLLYGLLAAVRGNPDVQEFLQQTSERGDSPPPARDLLTTLKRKTLAFVSDMLDEWLMVHGPGGLASGEHGEDVRNAALQLKPLGAEFLKDPWWLSTCTDVVGMLARPCLAPTEGDEHKLQRSVSVKSPVNLPEGVRFNEKCQVLSSSVHRELNQKQD
eukprot:g20516.t1